jgi:transcriptional regulator with XRE-family HTH domain
LEAAVKLLRAKYERILHGWSQLHVGVRAGVPQPQVGLIETGRLIPTPDQEARLTSALHLPPGTLLTPVTILDEAQMEALGRVGQLRKKVAALEREAAR